VRELRDRWLEKVISGEDMPAACGKYELSRSVGDAPQLASEERLVLPAA